MSPHGAQWRHLGPYTRADQLALPFLGYCRAHLVWFVGACFICQPGGYPQ